MRFRQSGFAVLGMFGLVGLLFLGLGLWFGLGQYRIITDWPTVQARVVSSQVTLTSPTNYGAEISFAYQAEGQPYTVSVASAYQTSVYTWMQELVAAFPAGSVRPLRYNPANPQQVVYDAGYTWSFFLTPLIFGLVGLIFAGIWIGPWLWARFRLKNRTGSAPSILRLLDLSFLLPGGFAGLGLIFLLLGAGLGYREFQARHWPTVQARILSGSTISYAFKSSSSSSRSTAYYAAALAFGYTVDGKSYVTPTSADADRTSPEEVEERIQTVYAPGSIHPLRYNPDNPNQIRFQDRFPFWTMLLAMMGSILLGIGLILLWIFGLSEKRAKA
ncbi:MAG: DUF3592 domain-containing protein [Candidatus Sericytochromatia bacterium]